MAVQQLLVQANQTALAGDNLVSVNGAEGDGVENRVQAPTKAPSEGSDGAVPDQRPDQSKSQASDSDTTAAKTEEPGDGASPERAAAAKTAPAKTTANKAAAQREAAQREAAEQEAAERAAAERETAERAAAEREAAERKAAAQREAAEREAAERAAAERAAVEREAAERKAAAERAAAQREAAEREAAERAAAERAAAERAAAQRQAGERAAAAQREAAERAAAERAAAQRKFAERAAAERAAAQREAAERAAAEQVDAANPNGTAAEATGQYGSGLMGVPAAQEAATEAPKQAAPSGSVFVPSYTGRPTPPPPAVTSNPGTGNARALASRLGSSFSGLTTAKPKPKSAQKPRPKGAPAPRRPAPSPVGQESRRAQLSLERVEPWSVMKFSFLLSLVGWVILFVAVAVLYFALSKLGVFHKIETTVGLVTSSKDNPNGANAASWFSASRVLGYTMLVGAINVIVLTALATIGAVLYNIVTSLTGGIEVTLKESD